MAYVESAVVSIDIPQDPAGGGGGGGLPTINLGWDEVNDRVVINYTNPFPNQPYLLYRAPHDGSFGQLASGYSLGAQGTLYDALGNQGLARGQMYDYKLSVNDGQGGGG